MDASAFVVALAAVAAIAGLGWFFFGPRKARTAELAGGVQRLEVTVRGGYSPEVIRLRQGVPAELTFDRQESGDCTSRVVFPDFQVSAALPAYKRTTVRLDPAEAGTFEFACGMNMIHGTLTVDPAPVEVAVHGAAANGHSGQAATGPGSPAVPAGGDPLHGTAGGQAPQQAESAQAAERQAEIRDLA